MDQCRQFHAYFGRCMLESGHDEGHQGEVITYREAGNRHRIIRHWRDGDRLAMKVGP